MDKFLNISVDGLQVNLMLRDEMDDWVPKQELIDLVHRLRDRLKKRGLIDIKKSLKKAKIDVHKVIE